MKTLRAAKPLTFEDKTIIPIEETTIYGKSVLNNSFIYASKKPSAFVVLSAGYSIAYDMKFEEVEIENLLMETEGLKELINNIL